eukprot:2936021-Amphidinium_carterae.1
MHVATCTSLALKASRIRMSQPLSCANTGIDLRKFHTIGAKEQERRFEMEIEPEQIANNVHQIL